MDILDILAKIIECEALANSNAPAWEQRINYRRQSVAYQSQIVQHVRDLEESLAHCQARTYGDELNDIEADCEDGGHGVQLKG